MSNSERRPMLLVVSSPSGGGKTTLCRRLLEDCPDITRSVSCTTRKPRGGEQDGRDYIFLSEDAFDKAVRNGEFLEKASVHGHRYGTLKKTVADAIASGRSVVLVIDVQGARQVREFMRNLPDGDPLRGAYVDLFVMPPSIEELRTRLEKRGEDSAVTIQERIRNAAVEIAAAREYKLVVLNDNLDKAYRRLREVLNSVAAQ